MPSAPAGLSSAGVAVAWSPRMRESWTRTGDHQAMLTNGSYTRKLSQREFENNLNIDVAQQQHRLVTTILSLLFVLRQLLLSLPLHSHYHHHQPPALQFNFLHQHLPHNSHCPSRVNCCCFSPFSAAEIQKFSFSHP